MALVFYFVQHSHTAGSAVVTTTTAATTASTNNNNNNNNNNVKCTSGNGSYVMKE